MNNKKHILNLDQFRDILQICPKIDNKKFKEPPLEKEILAFLASLGHSGEIRKITDINVNKLHQPWRSFAAIINKCLSGKPSYDSLRLSQAQILWGMYNNKKIDYASLLWEDFTYQIENKNTKKGNAMYYPRFTKLIVKFVMAKDPLIPRRNKVNWHYARDDPMFTTINVISRNEDTQLYGAILPAELINKDIRNSESYKEYYAIASGKIPPKTKASKKKADSDAPTMEKLPTITKEKKEKKTGKGKQKAKELETISEAVLTEAEQLKIITKRSRKETRSSHASGSGADEGTGVSPGVPDAPNYDSDDDISWRSSNDDQADDINDDDENAKDDQADDINDDDENAEDDQADDKNDDDENSDDDNADDNLTHPKLSTFTTDDQEEENAEEEKADDDDEELFDQSVCTPSDQPHSNESENQEDDDMEQDSKKIQDDEEMLYGNVNINLERSDIDMNADTTEDAEDTHVTLTAATPVVQQQSSSVSDLVSKFINPSKDEGIESVLMQDTMGMPITVSETPSPTVPITQTTQLIPSSTTTTTIPTTLQPEIPTFAFVFKFDQRVSTLESDMTSLKNSNPFAETVSSIPGIVDAYLGSKVKKTVDAAVQLKSDKLRVEAQAENQEFLNSLDSNMKKIIKEQVKAQTSKIKSKVEKYVTKTLKAEVMMEENKSIDRSDVQKNLYEALVEAYNNDKDLLSSYGEVLIIQKSNDDQDKDEEPSVGSKRGTKRQISGKEGKSSKEPSRKKSRTTSSSRGTTGSQPADLEDLTHQEFITGSDEVTPAREIQDERQWHPSDSPTLDRKWHQSKTVTDDPPQYWISNLAHDAGSKSYYDEFLATSIDFSAFMMYRLKIDHLTQEMLTGPTYDLIKGSCKSVAELDYHMEEVFKATHEQLDWNNPEGKPYPHNLSRPLPLIPNARGCLVIPFDHFINNDLEYLKGGSSSHKYTTSITKTKAAGYGDVKWIEDRIPRNTWSTVPMEYDRHAIIAITNLKIMTFYSYSHLEDITVRRQDDQLYKFREGDFKRLRRQDIKDMLLLLVQDKLTNLSLDDRYAPNVALRMYTRCIVIQARVEDLQLAVQSYQKKINLTKPDTYRLDLQNMTPYTAYPDIQGIIYQDDMSQNRLMHTDELHKFSDGTLKHVWTTLSDIATGIRMDYLPMRQWSKNDKQRARVMMNAIDRKLKDRRIMRSLEKFVGGRPYRYSNPMIQPEPEGSTQGYPLVSVEVLRYDTKGVKVLERLNTTAGNPVKKILPKLNLFDHRILKDGSGVFKTATQERCEHVGPEVTRPQDGKDFKMA
ncbi:hypothetical protein Tco_0972096 [Tanacetum coccineum]